MHQFLQIVTVGNICDRRTQYSLCVFPFLVSKMAESSTKRKISSNEGYLGVIPKKKPKHEPEENKFMFRVLLLNVLNLTPRLHEPWVRSELAKESDMDSELIPKSGI